jgi:hypothetical protein
MGTLTPILACHGGFDPGPGLTTLLLVTLAMWVVALIVAIPNVLMSCRDGKSSRYVFTNIAFFVVYLSLGLSLYGGRIFDFSMGFGIALIFLVPLMAVGHFIYLFMGRRSEHGSR